VLRMNSATCTRGGPKLYYSSAPLQCPLANINIRKDLPDLWPCSTYLYPRFAPHPCVYKKERRATITRTDEPHTQHPGDLGSEPSLDQFVTHTTNIPSARTWQLDTRRRVLLLGGPNQSKPLCL
jgi:hypothetical protein